MKNEVFWFLQILLFNFIYSFKIANTDMNLYSNSFAFERKIKKRRVSFNYSTNNNNSFEIEKENNLTLPYGKIFKLN